MLKRTKYFIGGLLVALTVGAIAQTGGMPSRPRFLSVGVGTAAPTTNGNMNVAGSITASNFIGNIGGVAPSDFARLSQSNTFTGSITASNFIGNIGGVSPSDFARLSQSNTFTGSITASNFIGNVGGVAPTDFARLSNVNVFTKTGGGSSSALQVQADLPGIALVETDASTNSKWWQIALNGETLNMQLRDDSGVGGGAVNWLTVNRTGQVANSINLQASSVQVNSVPLVKGAAIRCTGGGSTTDPVNAVSCTRTGTGEYTVTFDFSVAAGVCVASIHDTTETGTAKIANTPSGTTVDVQTFNSSFALADRAFSVVCLAP